MDVPGAQLARGKEGRSPLPFFENWKKSALILEKNALIMFIFKLNLSSKMLL